MDKQRQNVTIYLAERPSYGIVPGKTFASKTEPAPTVDDLKDGEVLVETLYLSLDPSMRGLLNGKYRKSYMPPVAIGQKMVGGAVSRVLGSKSAKANPGDIVHSFSGWTEVAIVLEAAVDVFLVPQGGKLTDILMAALNGPGPTAYIGMKNIAKVKPGETVVVSTAADGNGTLVVPHLPSGPGDRHAEVDVYWDNVGGQLLETLLNRAAKKSRFVICGGVSEYNTPLEERYRVTNILEVGKKRMRMEGFVVLDHAQEMPQVRAELFDWVAQGKLKIFNTILKGGIGEAENASMKLFEGENCGKLSLEVKAAL
ncbi:putative endo-polygalacturonase 6 [Apiospora phragmitis]|uniref:Endo-polygalacturonase 6 n=1 Tax=Apiospora phragmitis TaxID=2905665 RepID=A0ABR1U747_9PEZI